MNINFVLTRLIEKRCCLGPASCIDVLWTGIWSLVHGIRALFLSSIDDFCWRTLRVTAKFVFNPRQFISMGRRRRCSIYSIRSSERPMFTGHASVRRREPAIQRLSIAVIIVIMSSSLCYLAVGINTLVASVISSSLTWLFNSALARAIRKSEL